MIRAATFTLLPLFTMLLAVAEAQTRKTFHWGALSVSEDAVLLNVSRIPENHAIMVPRIGNPYKNVYLQSDSAQKTLKVWPGVKEWKITLPKDVQAPAVVVIETVGTPHLIDGPMLNHPEKDGEIRLPAHTAKVHGELLRYEPQPHKNTVGYWAKEKDWVQWFIAGAAAGDYEVVVLQGCGKGHGGSTVEVSVGESRFEFTVEDTGHFQNFKQRSVGKLSLPQGDSVLKVKPIKKAKVAVMDVRLIRLVPIK